jgi:hypothetical protein
VTNAASDSLQLKVESVKRENFGVIMRLLQKPNNVYMLFLLITFHFIHFKITKCIKKREKIYITAAIISHSADLYISMLELVIFGVNSLHYVEAIGMVSTSLC